MKAALALCVLLLVGPARAADFQPVEARAISVAVQDREGRDARFEAVKGKVTLFHFWASWCASCREEFPALDRLQKDMAAEGLRVITVSLDRMGWPVIDKTVEKLDLRYVAIYHDRNREAAQALAIEALPTTLLVDEAGREVARMKGSGDWDSAALRAAIRAAGRK